MKVRTSPALVSAILAASLTAACATSQAKTRVADPPPPPPRVIAPFEADDDTVPPSMLMPDEPARRSPPTRPPARPQQRETARPEAPKPEAAKPETEAKPPETTEPPPAPVHRLQPANEAEQERSIQNRIAAAERDLSRTDYRKLTTDVKNQYDTAKRLVEQAKDALRSRNFVFADSLADKAEKIAASLKTPDETT
jgi:hypothetical protein